MPIIKNLNLNVWITFYKISDLKKIVKWKEKRKVPLTPVALVRNMKVISSWG